MVKQRMKWSDAEFDGVVSRGAELYFNTGSIPDFAKAQDVLVSNRRALDAHRKKRWLAALAERIKLIRAELEKHARQSAPKLQDEPPVPVQTVAESPTVDLLRSFAAFVETDEFKRILAALRGDLSADLPEKLEAVIERLGVIEAVLDEHRDERRAGLAILEVPVPTPVSPATPPEVARVRLPRVLVAGLLGAQANVIKKRFGAKYDLRFAGANEATAMVRDRVAGADIVVVLTSFVSHPLESAIRAARTSTSKYIRVTGGVEAVARALEN